MTHAARMDPFTQAYFEAALWSTTDNADDSGGEPLDKNYSIGDIDDATRDKMIADCASFQERFGALIDDDDSADIQKYGASELAGYDFWMTRNGHGVGFWEDSDWPKHGEELDRGAKEYGEFDLYVGDDGMIYGSPLDRTPRAREHHGAAQRVHAARRGAASNASSLHGKLKRAGLDLDHHESDLYVRKTPEAEAIIRAHGGSEAQNARPFTSQDGSQWIDIPFAYSPFWEKKQRHAGQVRAPQGRWTVEAGRQLYFDGHPFAGVSREGNTEPVVADGLTNLIVELLNQAGTTPDQIYRRHMRHARRKRS